MKWVFLGGGILFYLYYTVRFTVRFAKMETHFTKKQRTGHLVMSWLVPFAWIAVLKIFLKPKEYIFPKKYKEKGYTMDHDDIHP